MSGGDRQDPTNELLRQGAAAARQWVDSVQMGERVSPSDFNWLGLAEVCALQARRGVEPGSTIGNDNIDWARASVSAYQWLADKDPGYAHSFTLSAMFLRAYLISRCGAKPGDPILDPQIIVDWFWQNVRMSAEEAVAKSAGWRSRLTARTSTGKKADRLEVTELRELRYIRLRLNVLRLLSEAGVLVPDASLKTWLDAREKLL